MFRIWRIWAVPGTVKFKVASQTLTYIGTRGNSDIFSDLGITANRDAYHNALAKAEFERLAPPVEVSM